MHDQRTTKDDRRKRPRVLITAGPTEEPLDAIRFISNRSSGRMGVELAREALRRGWQVTLVLGPSTVGVPKGIQLIRVRTALDMRRQVRRVLPKVQVLIMAAAVSDWRPVRVARGKIKRAGSPRVIRLVENPDILKGLGRSGGLRYRIGFCLEAGDPRREARRKLKEKKLDLIVANRLGPFGQEPFGDRPVTVWLIDRAGSERVIRGGSKMKIARTLFRTINGAMAE